MKKRDEFFGIYHHSFIAININVHHWSCCFQLRIVHRSLSIVHYSQLRIVRSICIDIDSAHCVKLLRNSAELNSAHKKTHDRINHCHAFGLDWSCAKRADYSSEVSSCDSSAPKCFSNHFEIASEFAMIPAAFCGIRKRSFPNPSI